jgi:membrane fusion protein (multidrug efflux system)
MSAARHATLALALVAAAAGCSRAGEKASLPAAVSAARGVRVARPATRIETGLARATGAVRAKEDAILSAKGTGQIHRILVNVGDRVRQGAPLVEMDATNVRIGLQNGQAMERLAAAGLAAAEKDLARGKVLFEQGSMPEAMWEKVQTGRDLAAAQHDQAKAALRAAEQAVTDATLVAPFSGTITARYRNVGDTVTLMPVTPILALTDLDHLEVRLAVPESIEGFVQVGQKITGVTTPGEVRFEARVRVRNAVVDPAARTVEVLADVTRAEGVRPGTLVNVDFGGFGDKDGLYVPTTALRTDGKESFVFVVAGGKAERRAVEVTPVHPGTVAVRKGLDPQSDVVQDPGSLVAGDSVIPLAN